MEKIDVLIWEDAAVEAVAGMRFDGLRSLQVLRAADLTDAPLLMGRGSELRGVAHLWVDSVDVWPEVAQRVTGDAYLVTESIPQPVARPAAGNDWLTHFTWFPKPERLTDEEFFHGWHVVHTPSSALLHPLRQGYVRDAVARSLAPSAPPVRAIVSEHFAEEVYRDPAQLFGSPESLHTTMEELPLYADHADISSCPLRPLTSTTW